MSTIKIADIKIGDRHRSDMGDIDTLKQSILDRGGLLHPIVLTPEKVLIAGRRRIEAYKQLGRAEIECTYLDVDDILLGERDENVCREDFSPSDAVAIADVPPSERLIITVVPDWKPRKVSGIAAVPGHPKTSAAPKDIRG